MFAVGKCRLNEILYKKRMTQTELAELLGMKKQQISQYANNERVMSYKTAKNISHSLGINMDELYYFVKIEQ